jgi:TonB family protein
MLQLAESRRLEAVFRPFPSRSAFFPLGNQNLKTAHEGSTEADNLSKQFVCFWGFLMNKIRFKFCSKGWRRAGVRLVQAAALALVVMLAIPARAADARAIKSRVAPVYPEIAKRMRIEGEVRLEVTVDAEGKVTDVKTVSGNRTLGSAAEDAVRKWRFEPGSGSATVNVGLTFALAQ